MAMDDHAAPEELDALRAHRLAPADVLRVTRHLAACAECAAQAREPIDAAAAASSLRAEMDAGAHPDLVVDLFAYADGTVDAARRAEIAEHLLTCARCRENVADARGERRRLRASPGRVWRVVAVAAAIAIALAWIYLMRPAPQAPPRVPRATPVVVTPDARPAEWQAIVDDALRSGMAIPPSLKSVRANADTLRGISPTGHAVLSPSGVVLSTDRPRFVWSSRGETAVVSVFDGVNRVAQSRPTTESSWTPEQPLARGRAYAWQVELTSNGTRRLMPVPPDPPAMFRIVDEASLSAIEKARSERPDDHLLLAILEARAGLKVEALTDFAQVNDERASALAAAVRKW